MHQLLCHRPRLQAQVPVPAAQQQHLLKSLKAMGIREVMRFGTQFKGMTGRAELNSM
jgi:hypothetical protein